MFCIHLILSSNFCKITTYYSCVKRTRDKECNSRMSKHRTGFKWAPMGNCSGERDNKGGKIVFYNYSIQIKKWRINHICIIHFYVYYSSA